MYMCMYKARGVLSEEVKKFQFPGVVAVVVIPGQALVSSTNRAESYFSHGSPFQLAERFRRSPFFEPSARANIFLRVSTASFLHVNKYK